MKCETLAVHGDRAPDPASFRPLIDGRTKALYVESMGNPLGNATDIGAVADIAHADGVPLILDNTAPTPWLLCPFELGPTSSRHCARPESPGSRDSRPRGSHAVDQGE